MTDMRRFFLRCLTCILALPAGLDAQFLGIDTASAESVEKLVLQTMAPGNIIGCSVGIVKNGRIVYLKGFGNRDLANMFPATEHTIYRTGSIAKTFTAVLALQLAEQGRLPLEEDARTYVPEYPAKPPGTIKVGHLLNHRSGIRHYAEYDSALLVNYETTHAEFDAIDAIDIFKDGSLRFAPGTSYHYTTFGYNLLGAVVERAAGRRFQDILEERLRQRLSLPYLQPEVGRLRPYPEETKGYDFLTGTLRQTIDNTGILYKVPGGGMVCTVIDLCLFMQGLMDGRVFDSTGTLDAMGTDFGNGYGLGVFLGSWNGYKTLSHGGGQEKAYSHYICVPDTRDGVVVLTNTFAAPADPLSRALLNLVPSLVPTGADYQAISANLAIPNRVYPDMDEVMYAPAVPLRWTTVPHADRYVVQIDRTPLFAGARTDTIRGEAHSISGLVPASTYYWRVRSLNPFLYAGAGSDWSASWRFRTPAATGIDAFSAVPSKPTLVVYPNPARARAWVRLSGGGMAPSPVSLFRSDGKLVRTWGGSDVRGGMLNLHGVPAGMYLLRTQTSPPMSALLVVQD